MYSEDFIKLSYHLWTVKKQVLYLWAGNICSVALWRLSSDLFAISKSKREEIYKQVLTSFLAKWSSEPHTPKISDANSTWQSCLKFSFQDSGAQAKTHKLSEWLILILDTARLLSTLLEERLSKHRVKFLNEIFSL